MDSWSSDSQSVKEGEEKKVEGEEKERSRARKVLQQQSNWAESRR